MIVRRVVPKTENNTRIKRRIKAANHHKERKSRSYLREVAEDWTSSRHSE